MKKKKIVFANFIGDFDLSIIEGDLEEEENELDNHGNSKANKERYYF